MGDFLPLLHRISINLSEQDLEGLKFLCRENIGKKKLEGVKKGTDLFAILMEQNEISSNRVDVLCQLLNDIKRKDLEEEVKNFAENGLNNAADQPDPPARDQLNAAFLVICDNVGRDWKMLVRRLGVPEARIDGIVAAYPQQMREQLMESLKEWQRRKGRDARVSDLLAVLRGCRLALAADRVEEELNKCHITR